MVHMTHRLSTAILRIVKATNHFNAITQKIQMVSEMKYYCILRSAKSLWGWIIVLTKRQSFI
jgi:hypothetical protein